MTGMRPSSFCLMRSLHPRLSQRTCNNRFPHPPYALVRFLGFLGTALTLLWSVPVPALGWFFALSQGEYDCCLSLDHLLSRSRARPVAPPGFDSAQFGFGLLLRPQHSPSPVLKKLVQLFHSTIPIVSDLRGWLEPYNHRARGQQCSQYCPPPPLHDPLLAVLSIPGHHLEDH